MKRKLIIGLLLIFLVAACEKNDIPKKSHAEVIGFTPDKCYCCWGWAIKVGDDTIKPKSVIIGENIGYEFEKPVKVNIELGEIETECSDYFRRYSWYSRDYYEVIKIERME